MKRYVVQIQYEDREGEFYIPLPNEMLPDITKLGWTVDDELEWIDNNNGTFSIKKKEKEKEV